MVSSKDVVKEEAGRWMMPPSKVEFETSVEVDAFLIGIGEAVVGASQFARW